MGQCIGKRNYRFFLGFVNSVTALCCFTLVLSIFVAYHLGSSSVPVDLKTVTVRAPATMALCGLTGMIACCVGPLACYHCSLVCNNATTSEEVKETYPEGNPFSKGCSGNCHETCCEPREPPRLLPRALASEGPGGGSELVSITSYDGREAAVGAEPASVEDNGALRSVSADDAP
jgi:palmitoyltransferase ZDHHC9/14/18